ncbi:MAG TPA: hypothetical protein DIU08_05145 [Ktedonobacter sp.]|nr:hypothetical protein [Ktedonobacter sp.]HCJ36243.1 hypothetical protein [Ktedonobacter sp.]HCP74009.1 hypothetical protein [Ktedonobacter sp.]
MIQCIFILQDNISIKYLSMIFCLIKSSALLLLFPGNISVIMTLLRLTEARGGTMPVLSRGHTT